MRKLALLTTLILCFSCSQEKPTQKGVPGAEILGEYLLEAVRMIRAYEYDSAKAQLIKIDSLSAFYGNRYAMASVLANYGWMAHRNGAYDSASMFYQMAIEIDIDLKDTAAWIFHLRDKAQARRGQARFSESAVIFEEALSLALKTNDSSRIASVSNALGNVMIELEEYDKALDYYNRAARIWRESDNQVSYSIAIHNLGDALRGLGRLEEALSRYKDALRLKRELNRISSSSFSLNGLGRTYLLLDSIDKANEVLEEALEIRGKSKNKASYAESLLILARVSVTRRQYRKAEAQLKEVERIAVEYNKADLLRDAFEDQRALYKVWDKLRKLAIVDEFYDFLTDSLYRQEKLRVQEAQSTASLQREQQKTILAEQNVRLANLELQTETQKSQFWLILGIVAMLGIVIIAWQLLQIRKQNVALITLNSRIKLITDNAFHSQKNALGLISALLRSKARQTDHEKELEVLKDVEGKIEALGGVAKSLFQRRIEDNTAVAARIQLRSYLEELVDDTFSSVASQAELDLSVEDIETTSTEALNIGLITNEAVTNFSKYAESAGADTLLIRVTKEEGTLHLHFTDNGPGFPEGFDFSSSTGFGMQMMANLVEDMDGEIRIKREDDLTLIEVEIPLKA